MKSITRPKIIAFFATVFSLLLGACAQSNEAMVTAVGLTPAAAPPICYRYPHTLRLNTDETTAADEAAEKQRIVDDRERLADRLVVCRRYMCGIRPDKCRKKSRPTKAKVSWIAKPQSPSA